MISLNPTVRRRYRIFWKDPSLASPGPKRRPGWPGAALVRVGDHNRGLCMISLNPRVRRRYRVFWKDPSLASPGQSGGLARFGPCWRPQPRALYDQLESNSETSVSHFLERSFSGKPGAKAAAWLAWRRFGPCWRPQPRALYDQFESKGETSVSRFWKDPSLASPGQSGGLAGLAPLWSVLATTTAGSV